MIKILGFHNNNHDTYDTHLNIVKGKVIQALMELDLYLCHINLKTRREAVYVKAISSALYGAELYSGQIEAVTTKITGILMRCNHSIFRKDWFKVSNSRICKEILVDHQLELCRKASLQFFHKLVWHKKPDQMYKMLKFSQRHRECSNISINDPVRN